MLFSAFFSAVSWFQQFFICWKQKLWALTV